MDLHGMQNMVLSLEQGRNQRGAIGQFPPFRNFHKCMYLLGTATSYIILPPPKISVGCGPALGNGQIWLGTSPVVLIYFSILPLCRLQMPLRKRHSFSF